MFTFSFLCSSCCSHLEMICTTLFFYHYWSPNCICYLCRGIYIIVVEEKGLWEWHIWSQTVVSAHLLLLRHSKSPNYGQNAIQFQNSKPSSLILKSCFKRPKKLFVTSASAAAQGQTDKTQTPLTGSHQASGHSSSKPKKAMVIGGDGMDTVAGQLLFISPTKVTRLQLLIILFDDFLITNLALIPLLP